MHNLSMYRKSKMDAKEEVGGGWVTIYSFIIVTFFHFLISAATGAAAPGWNGTVNAAD